MYIKNLHKQCFSKLNIFATHGQKFYINISDLPSRKLATKLKFYQVYSLNQYLIYIRKMFQLFSSQVTSVIDIQKIRENLSESPVQDPLANFTMFSDK